jgi:hypothetical protein
MEVEVIQHSLAVAAADHVGLQPVVDLLDIGHVEQSLAGAGGVGVPARLPGSMHRKKTMPFKSSPTPWRVKM